MDFNYHSYIDSGIVKTSPIPLFVQKERAETVTAVTVLLALWQFRKLQGRCFETINLTQGVRRGICRCSANPVSRFSRRGVNPKLRQVETRT